MRVLFVSSDITHHLTPFFESLQNEYGKDNCTFAVLSRDKYRKTMGFPEYESPYLFFAYKHEDTEYVNLWNEADIVITRIWDRLELIKDALQKGKQVFYASERWFKPKIGILRLLVPSYFKRFLAFRELSRFSNFYYLAMGYYAAEDFHLMRLCKDRIFSFGYFTPTYNPSVICPPKDSTLSIIWAGRMLQWKRVIDILVVFKSVVNRYNVKLTIIGDGPERQRLVSYVKKYNIPNVTIMNYIDNCKLKELMYESDIYILPSSGYEGWGAVINEAMQTKCAVIASKETGAARSIITDGLNGLTYPSGKTKIFEKKLVFLLEDKKALDQLKEYGYKTITESWSANVAAKRFKIVSDSLLHNKPYKIFSQGPLALIY